VYRFFFMFFPILYSFSAIFWADCFHFRSLIEFCIASTCFEVFEEYARLYREVVFIDLTFVMLIANRIAWRENAIDRKA